MATNKSQTPAPTASGKTRKEEPLLPGQAVLVMQGGGALGAFQAGVYEGMHEAGIEPDWIVCTSIGAINGAIIAGNAPTNRLARLREFWELVASAQSSHAPWSAFGLGNLMHNLGAVSSGIPGFFTPNLRALYGPEMPLGVTDASFYTTTPLRHTLERLVDFERLAKASTRLTLGAVNVGSGQMRYFDNRQDSVGIDHVMASGALPPAFAAVMIDDEPHWDGGVYSNTPIEVVMDDNPRRDSVIFAAQLWQQQDDLPDTIAKVISRLKDIQYASRAQSHTVRQQQIHHLRHVVRELGRLMPDNLRNEEKVRELLAWGCGTVMHVLPLQAPVIDGEDNTKDLDFTTKGIHARWQAGREFALQKIAAAPWNAPHDAVAGIVMHA